MAPKSQRVVGRVVRLSKPREPSSAPIQRPRIRRSPAEEKPLSTANYGDIYPESESYDSGEDIETLPAPIYDDDVLQELLDKQFSTGRPGGILIRDGSAKRKQENDEGIAKAFQIFINDLGLKVTRSLASARDWVVDSLLYTLFAQWNPQFLNYLTFGGLFVLVGFFVKVLQYFLIDPLEEISLYVLPKGGYILAAVALVVVTFTFTTAVRFYGKFIKTTLHIVLILYLVPRLFEVYDKSLGDVAQQALKWIWEWNMRGFEKAMEQYFARSRPLPLHVQVEEL